jgi:hypothetical protein
MLDLQARRHPHLIARPCPDRAEAECWARELTWRGFIPVLTDVVRYLSLVDDNVAV